MYVSRNEKQKQATFSVLQSFFSLIYKGELTQPGNIDADLAPKFKNMDLVAITRDKAIMFSDNQIIPQTSYAGAVGTGNRSIYGAYYVLKDVELAFKINAELDPLSSEAYMSVMADTLNPFVVE